MQLFAQIRSMSASCSAETKELFTALAAGDMPGLQLALLDGADVHGVGMPGTGCVACAATGGHLDALAWAAEQGCELDARDYGGATPLMEACRHGRLAAAQWLVERGADLRAADANGWTHATVAALRGHAELLRLLARAGAPLSLPDSDGKTPLDWASDDATREVLRELGGGAEGTGGVEEGAAPSDGRGSRAKKKAGGGGGGSGGAADAAGASVPVLWQVEILDAEEGVWHEGECTAYCEASNSVFLRVPELGMEGDVPLDLDFINLNKCADGASQALFDVVQHRYAKGELPKCET